MDLLFPEFSSAGEIRLISTAYEKDLFAGPAIDGDFAQRVGNRGEFARVRVEAPRFKISPVNKGTRLQQEGVRHQGRSSGECAATGLRSIEEVRT